MSSPGLLWAFALLKSCLRVSVWLQFWGLLKYWHGKSVCVYWHASLGRTACGSMPWPRSFIRAVCCVPETLSERKIVCREQRKGGWTLNARVFQKACSRIIWKQAATSLNRKYLSVRVSMAGNQLQSLWYNTGSCPRSHLAVWGLLPPDVTGRCYKTFPQVYNCLTWYLTPVRHWLHSNLHTYDTLQCLYTTDYFTNAH